MGVRRNVLVSDGAAERRADGVRRQRLQRLRRFSKAAGIRERRHYPSPARASLRQKWIARNLSSRPRTTHPEHDADCLPDPIGCTDTYGPLHRDNGSHPSHNHADAQRGRNAISCHVDAYSHADTGRAARREHRPQPAHPDQLYDARCRLRLHRESPPARISKRDRLRHRDAHARAARPLDDWRIFFCAGGVRFSVEAPVC